MQKFKIKVTRKNGSEKTVAVYLDDTTARLLKSIGDKKLLFSYLLEEYKSSRRDRQERFWNKSLEENLENGVDFEDKHIYDDFSFDDMNDEHLLNAIKQLTPRQQEMLRLMYIEGKTQKEIAQIFCLDKRSTSDAIKRIYASIQRNYKK